MVATAPRLLVSLPERDDLHEELAHQLPDVPVAFATARSRGPWPLVEALLVGTLQRELPDFDARWVPKLRFVQRIYTGLDDLPFDRFAPEVQIAGNVGGFAPFVAEQAIALLLAISTNLAPNFERIRQGRLRPVEPPRWLGGRTALLLGFGAIARELAVRLRALGVRVHGVSRSGAADPLAERMYPSSALLGALAEADIVVDCRPLTARTRATIDATALQRMRPTAMLVNVGRAETVDPEALFAHLRAHPGFRFGTDVLWREDIAAGTFSDRWAFASLPNFVASPHVAGVGPEPRARALRMAVENLARFFGGTPARNVADRGEYVEGRPDRGAPARRIASSLVKRQGAKPSSEPRSSSTSR